MNIVLKKPIIVIVLIALSVTMTFSFGFDNANAAAAPSKIYIKAQVSSKTVDIGSTLKVSVYKTKAKNAAKNVSWKIIKGKKYAGLTKKTSKTVYVKGKKTGTVTIKATSKYKRNNKKATKTIKIKVKNLKAKSIKLDSKITVQKNDTGNITAAVTAPQKYGYSQKTTKWSSSNTKVATVDNNGIVKGISEGQTVIRASNDGKMAKCTVTVPELKDVMNGIVNQGNNLSLAGLGVVAVKDNDVAFEYGGGYRYIDNSNSANNKPFSSSTRMRIASVSKTFVAVGIMQLVEKGQIDLDEDVSSYLNFQLRNKNFPDKKITCRMLLTHTSSIVDGEGPYSIEPKYGLDEFFKQNGKYYANGEKFSDKAPGSYFEYANINFAVLATVIEKVSGKRFDTYENENILEPMGIGASYNVSDFDSVDMDNLAAGYKKNWDANGAPVSGSKWIATVDNFKGKVQDKNTIFVTNPDSGGGMIEASLVGYTPGTNASCFNPAGGLRISADELSTYIMMYMNDGVAPNGNRILTKDSVDKMFTKQWVWNGKEGAESNGNSEYGLFGAWGLGLQIIVNGENNDGYGDTFLKDRKDLNLAGHYGDAYNMFSIFMLDRASKSGFVYTCNGAECDIYSELPYGAYSENWIWEEQMVTALYNYILD